MNIAVSRVSSHKLHDPLQSKRKRKKASCDTRSAAATTAHSSSHTALTVQPGTPPHSLLLLLHHFFSFLKLCYRYLLSITFFFLRSLFHPLTKKREALVLLDLDLGDSFLIRFGKKRNFPRSGSNFSFRVSLVEGLPRELGEVCVS